MTRDPYRMPIVDPPQKIAYCPDCRWYQRDFDHGGNGELVWCREPTHNPTGQLLVHTNNGKLDRSRLEGTTFVRRWNSNGECDRFEANPKSWWDRLFGSDA